MISSISFKSNIPHSPNKKNNNVNQAAVVGGSTLAGGAGGFALFKIGGVENEASNSINNIKEVGENTIKEEIEKLEKKRFSEALNEEKYLKFMQANVWGDNKQFNKDFGLKDFLDEIDMKRFNERAAERKAQLEEAINQGIADIKKSVSKPKWKHIGIGSLIGGGIGAVAIWAKSFINNKNKQNG